MQEIEIWKMLLQHLGGKETKEESELFSKWINECEENKAFFCHVKTLWNDKGSINKSFIEQSPLTFFGRFTKQKMKNFIFNQTIGKLIGFMVGMWVTTMFSHNVLEKRRLKNLFGLRGQKKIVVNDIPEWLQNGIAILVGFIALELINHFFQSKKHILIWDYLKKIFLEIKERGYKQ